MNKEPSQLEIQPWNRYHLCIKQSMNHAGEAEPPQQKDAILGSFEDEYRELLQALPQELFPKTSKHGKHSFTV